jgi:hypothetical protein
MTQQTQQTGQPDEFAALIEDLNKAYPVDAAAGDDEEDESEEGGAPPEGDEEGEPDGDEADGAGGEDDDDSDADETFGKAFQVTLADGSRVEAYDGTALLKALHTRVAAAEATRGQTLAAMRAMRQALDRQSELIKSLAGQVKAIGRQGRGRKSVLDVHERPGAVAEPGKTPREILAKALAAQKAGRITGEDVAVAEGYVNSGREIPATLKQRIEAA